MIVVLSVILMCLIKQPTMTCCIGSVSAHLGNSYMVEFESSIFFVKDSTTRLFSNNFCNINSTIIDVQSIALLAALLAGLQPFNQYL